jgi:hypothetical protein
MQNLFALMPDGSDHLLVSIIPSRDFFLFPLEAANSHATAGQPAPR